MSIKVTYSCCGCFAEETVVLPYVYFDSFSGRGHGFGYYRYPDIRKHVPHGWVDYDPYTHLTYCPTCIEDIWPSEKEANTENIPEETQ